MNSELHNLLKTHNLGLNDLSRLMGEYVTKGAIRAWYYNQRNMPKMALDVLELKIRGIL